MIKKFSLQYKTIFGNKKISICQKYFSADAYFLRGAFLSITLVHLKFVVRSAKNRAFLTMLYPALIE